MRGRTRREPRLDPVRWRRPGRSTLLRAAVVAALIVTAALLMWTGPATCEPSCPAPPGPAAVTESPKPPAPPSPSPGAVPPGLVGVPIRLAEPTALKLLHPGDHVDLFRVTGTGGSPQAVATAAVVLGVTGAEDPTTGGLLLALTPAEARRTVISPAGGYAVLIRPDG
jgi:hypothetical protein